MKRKFQKAFKIIRILKKSGFDAYLVGGAVRDYLLGLKPNDIDITTSAKPGQVMKLFSAKPTGLKYGTVTIIFEDETFEVTTFRIEENYNDYRHPESVIYTDQIGEDVVRRDFTINALLMDEKGDLVDLVEGKKDLDQKVIRAIGNPIDRFNEDALRILRACYFESKLGFSIDESTKIAMNESKELLLNLPVERIYLELTKILYQEHALSAFKTLVETHVADVLPFVGSAIKHFIQIDTKPYIDTFWAVAYVLNQKADTYYKMPNKDKHKYEKVLELYLKNQKIDAYTLYVYGLDIIVLYDKINYYLKRPTINRHKIYEMHQSLPIKSMSDLKIQSKQLIELSGKKQGAWLGNLQELMVKEVLYNRLDNQEDALINFAKASKYWK